MCWNIKIISQNQDVLEYYNYKPKPRCVGILKL